MGNNLGFTYELRTEKDHEWILTETISGAPLGIMLEHIAKTIHNESQSAPVVLTMLDARTDTGKTIAEDRLESLNILVTLAAEHYNQKIGKLVVETKKRNSLAENLKVVLANPKKVQKLVSELTKPTPRYANCPNCNRDNINLGKPTSWGMKDKKMVCKACLKKPVNELELPDLEIGDTLLVGKFKNRKAEIKGFDTDEHGQPTAQTTKGDQKIFKPRIAKLMPGAEPKAEVTEKEDRFPLAKCPDCGNKNWLAGKENCPYCTPKSEVLAKAEANQKKKHQEARDARLKAVVKPEKEAPGANDFAEAEVCGAKMFDKMGKKTKQV